MALRPAFVPAYLLITGSLGQTIGEPVCLHSGLWVSSWAGTEWWTWAGDDTHACMFIHRDPLEGFAGMRDI